MNWIPVWCRCLALERTKLFVLFWLCCVGCGRCACTIVAANSCTAWQGCCLLCSLCNASYILLCLFLLAFCHQKDLGAVLHSCSTNSTVNSNYRSYNKWQLDADKQCWWTTVLCHTQALPHLASEPVPMEDQSFSNGVVLCISCK